MREEIRFRVYIAFTAVCLFGLAVLIKAAMIQTYEGDKLRQLAKEIIMDTAKLTAERGNIISEDGKLLCATIPHFDIYVDFTVINKDTFTKHVGSLAASMSDLFKDGSTDDYESALTENFNKRRTYRLIKRDVPFTHYQKMRGFPIFRNGRRRGGFIAIIKSKRRNPYDMLAYRTIGLYRPNIKNNIGIECAYDHELEGKVGLRLEQVFTGGVKMPVKGAEVQPINGRDVVTTLDMAIQEVAEHAMMSVLKAYDCQEGVVIVMEVKTGKIKALVNLGEDKGDYYENQNYSLLTSEPGSTFKLATLLALLRDNLIDVEQKIDCGGGERRFFDRRMDDAHKGLGLITIREAFAKSSNVAMATLAQRHYGDNPNRFLQHLSALHLDRKTGIDLKGEPTPYFTKPSVSGKKNPEWRKTTLPWMATGYGVQISPFHTCMLYNAIANDGCMMKPYLVSAISEYGVIKKRFEPTVLMKSVAPPKAIRQLRKCLEEVVTTGTAKSIKSPLYRIAGKTGTAQVVDVAHNIGYNDGAYRGSFVGYFPADNPRYTMLVTVRTKTKSSFYYGGALAAPIFKMIADKVFTVENHLWGWRDYAPGKDTATPIVKHVASNKWGTQLIKERLDVPLTEDASSKQQPFADAELGRFDPLGTTVRKGVLPDLTGMGLKEAIFLLEQQGMYVTVQGTGVIRAQSIAAGVRIRKGQQIALTLN